MPTSNQLWAGRNRRFERRAGFLHRFGFRYLTMECRETPDSNGSPTLGVFVRSGMDRAAIPAGIVMLLTPAQWREYLTLHLRTTT